MTLQPKHPLPLTIVQTQKQEISCHHCNSDKFVKKRKSKKGHQIYICKSCGRHFTYNPDKIQYVVNPETEYKKDVWDCRNLGISPGVGCYSYRLTFLNISQIWLREATKRYIKFTLSTLSFSSGSEKLLAIKRLSRFLAESYPNISPQELNRSVIIDFLAYLASTDLSISTRRHSIGAIRGFLEMSYQNEWLEVSRYLIRDEDFPKIPKSLPRYIPEDVMQQLNQHLEHLPEPVMRMVLVLQECGMRISELLHLKADCLLQDKAGDWFMRYYQFKMKKEITIPISREVVQVIQEQLRYIKENLNIKFEYVFSSNQGGGWKNDFNPAPELMSRGAFSRYLNKLAESCNICDTSGNIWHFLPHQFRHTVGTRMINNRVPQHIIQRYLGHESPNMTAVYAHIHDQTMKEEIARYQGKIVNISGLVVEPNNIEADIADLQWFKKNIHAQALPNGSCALPTISQGCPHANACFTCAHFRTTSEYLAEHKQQLEHTNQIIQKAEANGWVRQVEMNQKVKTNLENIISVLEVDANDG
ncbi:tyrosine-type recombinase/integrase [Nostoc sp.]|uniref:tyrosine-type recombinase/integrase n=1 Tax=Nostoc sp. TaxID=1180 RepID=UPI003FA59DDB